MKEINQIKKQVLDVINVAQISQKDQDVTTSDLKNLTLIYKTSLECLSRIEVIEESNRLKSIEKEYIDQIILLLRENKYNSELFDIMKKYLMIHGLSENDPALLAKLINLDLKENKNGKIVASLKCDSMEFDE